MRITGVDCHILLDPGYEREATSSNQDDIVVEVHTDAGITGIGETDLNAWVARECIEARLLASELPACCLLDESEPHRVEPV